MTMNTFALTENLVRNVKLMKRLRGFTDDTLARACGFPNRQQLNNRMVGVTPFKLDDVARLAAALRVEPVVLLGPDENEVARWALDHPDFQAAPPPPAVRRSRAASTNANVTTLADDQSSTGSRRRRSATGARPSRSAPQASKSPRR
jgi:hypothetical protein